MTVSTHLWSDAARHAGPLLAAIAAARAREPRSSLDVAGGWSGSKNLQADPRVHPLRDWLAALLPDGTWELALWGKVYSRLDGVRAHDHAKSHRGGLNTHAGVYWLYVPPGSQPLQFPDLEIMVVPAAGTVCLFDALDVHEVAAHRGAEQRVSIGFNVRAI